MVVETGTGITMSAGCNLTQWFAWVLMVLTGAMNRKGGAWFHPGFLSQFENFELPVMDAWTPGPTTRPDVLGIIGDWPCAVLPAEIEAGNIRALMNFGGSLMRSFPDTNALGAALQKLDLHVNTEIVHNETTPLCTHVLPTKDAVERAEIRRWDTLAWNVSMQYTPPLVEPMGERRSAWWVISQIMRRAGMPVPDHVPDDDRQEGADELMLAKLFKNARCSFEEVEGEALCRVPARVPGAVGRRAHRADRRLEAGATRGCSSSGTRCARADEAALGQAEAAAATARAASAASSTRSSASSARRPTSSCTPTTRPPTGSSTARRCASTTRAARSS